MPTLQTEFPFTLPKGFVDAMGNLHREGSMRLATALDEIAPLRDPRVKGNEAYLTIIILARVITRLGNVSEITTGLVESLFTADLAYLQALYQEINATGAQQMTVACPHCGERFDVELPQPGGS